MFFFKKKKEIEAKVHKVYCESCYGIKPTFHNSPAYFFRLCGDCFDKQYPGCGSHIHAMFDHLARRISHIETILREQEISDGYPKDYNNPFKDN